MGKRTKEKSDEEIKRKIRRLKKELNSREIISPTLPQNEDRDADSIHVSSYNYRDEAELDAYLMDSVTSDEELPEIVDSVVDIHIHPSDKILRSFCKAESSQHIEEPVTNNVKSVVVTNTATEQDIISDEIMEILGEAKKSGEKFGKKIPQGVSERLGKILIDGLDKEQKKTLLSESLIIPESFQLTKAPKLNAEVASVLTDPANNRDKRLEKLQNQLGSGIAGLVNLTTDLINKDLDKMSIIKRISEVNQVLLDLHYEETLGRRRLIIPMLDKNFINVIQNVKRDQFLFGDNLGDNIKTSKSIERSSLQIKKPAQPQPSTSKKPFGQPRNLRGLARQGSGPNMARAQPATSRYYTQPLSLGPRKPPATTRCQPPPPPSRGRPQDYRARRL